MFPIKVGKLYKYQGKIVTKHHGMEQEIVVAIQDAFINNSLMVKAPDTIEIKDITTVERNPRYIVKFNTMNRCDATRDQILYIINHVIMGCHKDIIGIGTKSSVTRWI